jgi:hypothetical protein
MSRFVVALAALAVVANAGILIQRDANIPMLLWNQNVRCLRVHFVFTRTQPCFLRS